MKKIIVSAFALVACCMSLTSFAFSICTPGATNFCSCFINNCKSTFPASECNYRNLKQLIESNGGAQTTCAMEGQPSSPTSPCVVAINSYLYNKPAENPPCSSVT